jgi:plasmid stabilization system protein ParE
MGRRKIVWSLRAKLDWFEILEFYHHRNGNKNFSIKINSIIKSSIQLLSNQSEIGLPTDIENVRILIEGNYEVFYQINAKTIEILTIWDSRQNGSPII